MTSATPPSASALSASLLLAHPVAGERHDRDRAQPRERHAAAERPGQQRPRRHPGPDRRLGHAVRERAGRHGAHDALGQQVGHRAGGDGSEQRRHGHDQREQERERDVDAEDPDGGHQPQRHRDVEMAQGHAQGGAALGLARVHVAHEPAAGRPPAREPPDRADHARHHDVGRRGGQVDEHDRVLVADLRQRQHPREQDEHDHGAGEVRAHDRGHHQQRRAARDPAARVLGAAVDQPSDGMVARHGPGSLPHRGQAPRRERCPRGHGGARRVAVACGHGQEAVAAAPPPCLPARPPDPRAPRRGAATRGLAQRRHHLVARGPRGPALPARRLAPPRDVSPSRTCRVPSTTATPPA